MVKTTGTAMNVFCLERFLAMSARRMFGARPSFTAPMSCRCAGRMRAQTFHVPGGEQTRHLLNRERRDKRR